MNQGDVNFNGVFLIHKYLKRTQTISDIFKVGMGLRNATKMKQQLWIEAVGKGQKVILIEIINTFFWSCHMKSLGCTFLIILGLLFSGGCDYVLLDVPELLGIDDDTAGETESQVEVYDGKVYLIGTLTGTLKEEFEETMTFTDYVAGATDGAIVISSDALGSLTQEQLDGLSTAFAAQQPIILVQATAEQITSFGLQFIGDSFTYNLPDGMTYAEVYAVDMEEGGDIWQWSLYPPDLTNDEDGEDSEAEQESRLGELIDWMQENSERMESAEAEEALENAKSAIAAGATTSNDLTQLASAFVEQSNFSYCGNRYQIAHFVYSCHSYATGEDWFYVQQQCVFNGSGAYKAKEVKSNQERKGWYMDNIEIDTTMQGYDDNAAAVGMLQSNPETANNVETVTSGVSFTIGGDVGVSSTGPSGKISGGVTINNSKTISVKDCEVVNKSNDRTNNAHWNYIFKRCNTIGYMLYAALTDPPKLSVNSFQPVNQWIWRTAAEVRNKKTPMHVKLTVNLCWTRGVIDWWWLSHPKHETKGQTWEYNVYIPYPPNTD
jgi:hypothetical protein